MYVCENSHHFERCQIQKEIEYNLIKNGVVFTFISIQVKIIVRFRL